MTLADVLAVAAGLAIAGAGFASLSVILSVLLPRAVSRARDQAERRPGRSVAIGALAAVTTAIAAGAFWRAPAPPLHVGAVFTILFALGLGVLGGAGLSAALGLRAVQGSGPAGVRDLLRGALLLESAALLPLVGWFIVLPASLLLALGAGVATLLVTIRDGARRAPALAQS